MSVFFKTRAIWCFLPHSFFNFKPEFEKHIKNDPYYQSYLDRRYAPGLDTGWDRVKLIFQHDEFDCLSPELNSIMQAGYLGVFCGAAVGGFSDSRIAYTNFIDNNQATAFDSHMHAKKELQTRFTLAFAKGAFKWGWRTGIFTATFYAVITGISMYRGRSSPLEYIAAGIVAGSMYKVNMGLRGMASGGFFGGVIGAVGGCLSLLIMKAVGIDMDDVRFWQYKMRMKREESIAQSIKNSMKGDGDISMQIFQHDETVADQTPTLAMIPPDDESSSGTKPSNINANSPQIQADVKEK